MPASAHAMLCGVALRSRLVPLSVSPNSDESGKQSLYSDVDPDRHQDLIIFFADTLHKAREHQQPLYMCFVDFKKAFDSISHDKLWITMMDMGYPLHLIDLLAKLYRKQLAKVKVAGTLSEWKWFPVKKGVRQGCVLSLYLFNIVAEMVIRETLDRFQGGLQIGGRMITNLRYADDIILLATSEARLSHPQIQPTHQYRQDQGSG